MRIVIALLVGLLTGIVFMIAFVYILAWNAKRMQPEVIHVGVGLVPTLVAFVVGVGVGVLLVMRR